jgi:hypothetical protein
MKEVPSFLFDGDRNWREIIKEVNSCIANKNSLTLKRDEHRHHAWRVKRTVTWPDPVSWANGKKMLRDRKLICWQYFLWKISILSGNNLHGNWADKWERLLTIYYKLWKKWTSKYSLCICSGFLDKINLTKLACGEWEMTLFLCPPVMTLYCNANLNI